MQRQTRKVLVVDDEPVLRLLFRSILEQGGYEVVEACDGADGLEAVRRESPDLVFTDLVMPVQDGFALIESMREEFPDTPVVAVSGKGTVHDAIGAMRLGAWDYVTKPFSQPDELTWAAARALERADLVRQNRAYRDHLEEEVRRRSAELYESEERYRALFENASDAILQLSVNGRIVGSNPKAIEMFGCPADGIAGRTLLDFSPERQPDGDHSARKLWQYFAHVLEGVPQRFGWRHVRVDGVPFDAETSLNLVELRGTFFLQAILRDVTEHRRYEERLRRQANYDALTGLPNRVLLAETLERYAAEAVREEGSVHVVLLDLDGFKYINDTLGHQKGDELLVRISERLRSLASEEELLARFMGDEFVFALGPGSATDPATLAARVLEAFRAPFTVGMTELFLTPSVGICSLPGGGDSGELLLKNAEAAMYAARRQGAGRCQRYTRELNARAEARLSMATRLHRALERGEFLLYYQPQFDLRTRETTGMEALLRWVPPGEPMVSPADFIPVLEEAGLIVPVGEWVLREGCRQLRAWLDGGMRPLHLSLNVSAWQFRSGRLLDAVAGALAEHRIDPRQVCLELTESIVMHDVEDAIRLMHALKELGLSLSIDDFGTGYSSLGYLRRMPIDELKIDRSFVMNLPGDANSAAIVRTIVGMADSLRMSVVAEGVETAEQLRFLSGLSCATGQGYLYSRPIPPDAFEAFLKEERT